VVNIAGLSNLRHLLHFYFITGVREIDVIDHMPDYGEMALSLIDRAEIDFPVDMLSVSTGFGLGMWHPEKFRYFYDDFVEESVYEDPLNPYLFRALAGKRGGTLAGFNFNLKELSTYALRALVEKFSEARSFISVGPMGLLPDYEGMEHDLNPVLPGDLFVPRSIRSNGFRRDIKNGYLPYLTETLKEKKLPYQVIELENRKKKVVEEYAPESDRPQIKIVVGNLFSVDSLAAETTRYVEMLKSRNIHGVEMEAADMVQALSELAPEMELFLAYFISDIPGYINYDVDPSVNFKSLLERKSRLAFEVLGATAHKIYESQKTLEEFVPADERRVSFGNLKASMSHFFEQAA
jgi:hypothetical protein